MKLDAKLPSQTNKIIYPAEDPSTFIENLQEISLNELMKVIKQIDVTKSSGFIGITTEVLKVIFTLTPLCLLHILKRCIFTNLFPTSWKTSLTTSIPKKGDPRLLKNIRPISILPRPGKLLEKFINQELTNYLDYNLLHCNEQGGFRRNHSTAKSCYDILLSIYNANNLSKSTMITYIHFAKAFNTINHIILFVKLSNL